jgi:hypothetical protein
LIDLDPGRDTFTNVVAVAKETRKVNCIDSFPDGPLPAVPSLLSSKVVRYLWRVTNCPPSGSDYLKVAR